MTPWTIAAHLDAQRPAGQRLLEPVPDPPAGQLELEPVPPAPHLAAARPKAKPRRWLELPPPAEEEAGKFAMVAAEVVLDGKLSDAAKSLYQLLALRAHTAPTNRRYAHGCVYGQLIVQLAADTGKSYGQTMRLLAELRAHGHVRSRQVKGRGLIISLVPMARNELDGDA